MKSIEVVSVMLLYLLSPLIHRNRQLYYAFFSSLISPLLTSFSLLRTISYLVIILFYFISFHRIFSSLFSFFLIFFPRPFRVSIFLLFYYGVCFEGTHDFKVRMGFGLHAGWAIEGAVGTYAYTWSAVPCNVVQGMLCRTYGWLLCKRACW